MEQSIWNIAPGLVLSVAMAPFKFVAKARRFQRFGSAVPLFLIDCPGSFRLFE